MQKPLLLFHTVSRIKISNKEGFLISPKAFSFLRLSAEPGTLPWIFFFEAESLIGSDEINAEVQDCWAFMFIYKLFIEVHNSSLPRT